MYFIIADDLTGATDTGIQFQKRGIATTVLVEPPKEALSCPGERTALSVNASSRELRPQEAAVRTREVLQHIVLCDQDTLFKKVDSLMRGNPVEELEAALEAAGRRIALAAPSFPRMGRTVDGGAAGQRAAHTNLDCIGTLRSLLRAASGEHCGYHQGSHQHSKYFFHDSILLFHFLL